MNVKTGLKLASALCLIGSLVVLTTASPASAATISDGKDAPSRAGDIKSVKIDVDSRKGTLIADVTFYKLPDSFMYVNVMVGRSQYGGYCSIYSGGGMWASFDPYDSSRADALKGSIQSSSAKRTGSTSVRYTVTSKTLQKGSANCMRVETAFMRDYPRWDSDCSCFTRVVDWDEVEGDL